jgi:hypothetical protein
MGKTVFQSLPEQQTRSMQKRILAEAARDGTLHTLYWYVELRLPLRWHEHGRNLLRPASFPHEWVPVIAVGDDARDSERAAVALRDAFAKDNPDRGFSFSVCLTAIDILTDAGVQWYRYGMEEPWGVEQPAPVWDEVCAVCGSVTRGEPCACVVDVAPPAIVADSAGVWHVYEAGAVACGVDTGMGAFVTPERAAWPALELCKRCLAASSKRVLDLIFEKGSKRYADQTVGEKSLRLYSPFTRQPYRACRLVNPRRTGAHLHGKGTRPARYDHRAAEAGRIVLRGGAHR